MALAGDHVQVLVAGYDMTGDMNRINIADQRMAHSRMTFADDVEKFILGQRTMALAHAGFMNADTGKSHPVLNGLAVEGVVSIFVGENADPVPGDAVYNLSTLQQTYQAAPEYGQLIPFRANFANNGNDAGWGLALVVPTDITNTFSGSSVDGGVASSNGGAAFLNILGAAASDTYNIKVQGSTTGAFSGEQSTLGTFSLDASAIGSERLDLSGTIPRYVRIVATRSGSAGDTVRFAASLVRF